MVTKDEEAPKATAQTKPAAAPVKKRPASLNNSVEPPDAVSVVKADAKAQAAREKLAKKNAVSVSKDDDENVLGVATEHFNVARASHFGIEVVNISKRGYVGPAQLTVTDDELDELIDALDKF